MTDHPRDRAAASDPTACPPPDSAAPSRSGDMPGLAGPTAPAPREARRSPRARARLVDAARSLGGLERADDRPAGAPDRADADDR